MAWQLLWRGASPPAEMEDEAGLLTVWHSAAQWLPTHSWLSHTWAMQGPWDTILVTRWAVCGWHLTMEQALRSGMEAAQLMVTPAHRCSWC